MKKIISFWVLLISIGLFAQMDTVVLNDLVITDIRLEKNRTQFVQQISDSVIHHNPPLLTEILNFYSPVFFKENGYGMVSSPSFRGTTASQTAVIWNGISINSGLLGQSDFNTISSLGYDEIKVKPGGGSVAHGSGAIGGSVHLNHNLAFNQGLKGDFLAGFSSFNTLRLNGKITYSNDKWSFQAGYNRNSSDNDYEVEKLNYVNHNGQFYNNTLNINASRKLNENNTLSLYVEGYEDERHFSLTEPTSNRTKYQNRNLRSLLQFDNQTGKLNSVVRLAFLHEKFEYWQNLQQESFSGGDLSSLIAKYDGTYVLNENMDLALIGEFINEKATGFNTGIDKISQNSGNFGLMFTHQLTPELYYEIGGRKEMNGFYDSPFLFSVGTHFEPVKWYELQVNVSRNFKAPSFNDLYWEPGGNELLNAETSLQFELGNFFRFKRNKAGVNLYLNDIKYMIRWVPTSAGYWMPANVDEVRNYGFEIFSELKHSAGSHTFSLNSSYAYTNSKNSETGMQISYVPLHKINGTFTHQYRSFSWYFQGLSVGQIFTTADENPEYTLKDYQIFNLGLNYELGREYRIDLGIFTRNLFDLAYEAYPYRVMPPRNFGAQLRFKF